MGLPNGIQDVDCDIEEFDETCICLKALLPSNTVRPCFARMIGVGLDNFSPYTVFADVLQHGISNPKSKLVS